MRYAYLLLFLLAALALLTPAGCRKDAAPAVPQPVVFAVPEGFPAPRQPVEGYSLEAFELGRRLFYEGALARDEDYDCASCHQQFAGFATYDHDFSHGFGDAHGTRNAPGLANLAWLPAFRQDGSAPTLEQLIFEHITAPDEMAETEEGALNKLRADPGYRDAFRDVFGNYVISRQRVGHALSAFLLNLKSDRSKWDRVQRGTDFYTPAEARGQDVFTAKCASCHTPPLFTDGSYRNNGLAVHPALQDAGRARVTGSAADSLKFRVPSLRNVAMTFPYMHDGRYPTLTDAIRHYRSGVSGGSTVDPALRGGLPLSDAEVTELGAFLRTLTDSSFLQSARFSRP